ncbi:MAG: SPOR domain-containing protein [Cyclobacteriaceae bacterium]
MISRIIGASLWKASLIMGMAILMYSCSPKVSKTSSKDSGGSAYQEDLSKYRPVTEDFVFAKAVKAEGNKNSTGQNVQEYETPDSHLKDEIDQVVQMTIDYNKQRNYIPGYSIQVYSGTEIGEVNKVEDRLHSLNYKPVTKFDSPIYRTKIGRYYTRLEANKDFLEIKKMFPLAVLVVEKFPMID